MQVGLWLVGEQCVRDAIPSATRPKIRGDCAVAFRSRRYSSRSKWGWRSLLLVMALTVATGLSGQAAYAAPAGAVLGGSHSGGIGANPVLGGLSAKWWKYALEKAVETSPLTDETGIGCSDGQSGPIFFLVGTGGGGTAVRDKCVVPRGKALFFPIANGVDVNSPLGNDANAEEMWEELQATYGFKINSLWATVDGVRLPGLSPRNPLYRGCVGQDRGCYPEAFSLRLPDNNLFALPPGTYKPAVSDGFYALIPPLSKGPHTLIFGGSGNFNGPFTTKTIYHLTVK